MIKINSIKKSKITQFIQKETVSSFLLKIENLMKTFNSMDLRSKKQLQEDRKEFMRSLVLINKGQKGVHGKASAHKQRQSQKISLVGLNHKILE